MPLTPLVAGHQGDVGGVPGEDTTAPRADAPAARWPGGHVRAGHAGIARQRQHQVGPDGHGDKQDGGGAHQTVTTRVEALHRTAVSLRARRGTSVLLQGHIGPPIGVHTARSKTDSRVWDVKSTRFLRLFEHLRQ